jgi:hypothetical protein
MVDIWRFGLLLLLSWLLGTFKPQGLPERIKSLALACGVVARLGWVNAGKFPPFGLFRGREDVKKSIFKFASQLGVKQIALGWRMSHRWAVGKHLGSKIKSRKVRQINFFTCSGRANP